MSPGMTLSIAVTQRPKMLPHSVWGVLGSRPAGKLWEIILMNTCPQSSLRLSEVVTILHPHFPDDKTEASRSHLPSSLELSGGGILWPHS